MNLNIKIEDLKIGDNVFLHGRVNEIRHNDSCKTIRFGFANWVQFGLNTTVPVISTQSLATAN